MSVHICHVTSLHSIDDLRVFHNECKSLSKKYKVTLVAPNVPDQEVDGVKIIGVSLPQNRLKRMLKLNTLLPVLLSIDAMSYHFHDPELIPIGIKMKSKGKKVIFDSHEDVPAQISQKNWIPSLFRGMVSKAYAHYEASNLKKYDALVSVTPSIVNRLKEINPHTFQITNYPKYIEYQDIRKWKRSICFAGGISHQWMHENIISSLDNLDVKYVLAGFADEEYLKKLKQLKSWSKVEYRGKLKYAEVPALIQESSIGMALNDYVANVGYHLGSLGNTKLFEYMISGIPVICTDFILWKEIIEKNDCGICVNPHNKEEISKAISFLINNPDKAREMGDNGKRAVREEYNWENQEKILYSLYEYVESI